MSKQPNTLTPIECTKLLEYIRDQKFVFSSKQKRMRNLTMTLLMLDAGLRVGEVVKLKVWDLYFGDHPISTLIITADIAKTHVERLIPTSERLIDQIDYMHHKYHPWYAANLNKFAFTSGTTLKSISVRTVEKIINLASLSSIGRKISPHTLRHTFATRLMQKTNIRVVQKLLGHKSITSTQIYTHPNQEDLTQAIKAIK